MNKILLKLLSLAFINISAISYASAACTTDANGTINAGSNGDTCINSAPLNPNPGYAGMFDGGNNNVTLVNSTSSGIITSSGTAPSGVGITSIGSNNSISNSGIITSSAANNTGILINGAISNSISNSGQIAISSDYSYGVIMSGANNSLINTSLGSIAVTGTGSIAFVDQGSTNTFNNAGTVSAQGVDGAAITLSSSGITDYNSGQITASGLGTLGIQITGDSLTLYNSRNISTTGDYDFSNIQSASPIDNFGTFITIINSGTISATGASTDAILNELGGSFQNIFNTGSITSAQSSGINNQGAIYNLVNQAGGLISGGNEGITNSSNAVITNLVNLRTATITGSSDNGIQNNGTITSLVNYGSITGQNAGIYNGNIISSLTNFGDISTFSGGLAIDNELSISTLTNYGTLSGGALYNGNYIGVLNNLQGQSGALVLTGNLPNKYNIIINSPSSFGKLDVSQGIYYGTTTFGIYGGGIAGVPASVVTARTYAGVLIGINSAADLNNVTSGTYNGFKWALNEEGISGIWDLIVTGVSTADTQQSLVNTASVLQGTFTLQNSVLANSFTYDCTEFGANNVCVSAGGRNTAVSAANGLNNTSALLIAAYRPHSNYRIGAYADQNLSVNNAGSTVNLGNNTPLIGLFGAWNERLDGTGTEVKLSVAYGRKNTTITRQVVGASEAGSGSSQLNSQGAQVVAKYGFGITEDVIISPYIGMRYTQNNMGGYTEAASSSVTTPLTYSALNTNTTAALAGVGVKYKVVPSVTTFASAGVESDTNTANGSYYGTNPNTVGLTPVNFNPNPVKTRPTATLGAYYDIVKNQRLGITGIYRQEPFQSVSTTTVMATYTVGF